MWSTRDTLGLLIVLNAGGGGRGWGIGDMYNVHDLSIQYTQVAQSLVDYKIDEKQ